MNLIEDTSKKIQNLRRQQNQHIHISFFFYGDASALKFSFFSILILNLICFFLLSILENCLVNVLKLLTINNGIYEEFGFFFGQSNIQG